MKKVVFVASSGGHLTELLELKEIFSEYEYLLVTEETTITKEQCDNYNVEFLKYGPNKNIFKYLYIAVSNTLKCFSIAKRFRPDTIVTTGAQIGGMMCLIGKLFKSRIIYIESLAKTNTLSITGKNIYNFADKFYVQWEELEKKYEKAEYIGRLI